MQIQVKFTITVPGTDTKVSGTIRTDHETVKSDLCAFIDGIVEVKMKEKEVRGDPNNPI